MNISATQADTALLAELISAKLKILQQVNVRTGRQPEIITGGDTGRLLHVLAAKERLLNDLRHLETRLEPYRDQDPDSRVWKSPEDRAQCRAESEQCAAILKEIMHIEKKCEEDLVKRRDLTAQRIHAAHDASRARTAYANDVGAARRLDLTSE